MLVAEVVGQLGRNRPLHQPLGQLREHTARAVWLNEYETLDDARRGIGGYVDRYHHRPHSGLDYRTPHEVARTWEDGQPLLKTAA